MSPDWSRTPGEGRVVVEVFGGRWSGLVLAEVEVADLDAPLPLPRGVGREVSSEEAFCGGVLAVTPLDDVAEALVQARAGWAVQA